MFSDQRRGQYLEAQEVLSELRRCRPAWVRRFISRDDKRNVRHFLNSQRGFWKDAQQDPGVGGERIDAYVRAASTTDPDGQRRVRQAVLQYRRPQHGFRLYSAEPEYREVTKSYGPAEFFWRQSALVEWQAAIAQKVPAVRDLRDWAGPSLTESAFRGRAQMESWYLEADGLRLPITRMKGLVSYYQLQRRITSGNPHDIEHSSHALICDMFLTADKSFYQSLNSARSHFQQAALTCFVDKRRGDPSDAIIDSIDDCMATSSDSG
jgi:hypothetical protein